MSRKRHHEQGKNVLLVIIIILYILNLDIAFDAKEGGKVIESCVV